MGVCVYMGVYMDVHSTHEQIHVHIAPTYTDTTFNHPFQLCIKVAFTRNHTTHRDAHVPLTDTYSVAFVCCRH